MTKITYLPQFKREFKRLSKKFHSLKVDMEELLNELRVKPDMGTPLGEKCIQNSLAGKEQK